MAFSESKVEEIVRAIGGLETLHGQLSDYTNGYIVRGDIIQSNESIEETILCLNTTLQILNTRLAIHIKREEQERVLEFRRCETCHVFLSEGYVINGGEEYFCNDHEPPYFNELYDADPEDGNTYWTQWED